jgi:pyruvate ferredoxin oxidoreductase alpha subunit
VMVCMDGFILTHAVERVDIPDQAQVDAFLPPYEPRQVLDPDEPISIGAMVGPEAFTEVRYLAHAKQMQALELIPEIAAEFAAAFGRDSGRPDPPLPQRGRRDDRRRARLGARHDQGHVDELRDDGVKIGASASPRSARSRSTALRAALAGAARRRAREGARGRHRRHRRANVRMALAGRSPLHGYTVIAGLGGRPITKASLREGCSPRRRTMRSSR